MRIVGGRLKGRGLKGPLAEGLRPTSDRLRESIFNVLAHAYDKCVESARVIDLFAGTGALALEALSRGARFALMVDDSAQARALIRENVEQLGLGGATRLLRRDATKLGDMPTGESYTLAFLDPPYNKGLGERALLALKAGNWLAADALILLEESADATITLPEGFELIEQRAYGVTQILFIRLSP
jgi:16S rRNA (guanine966-N2)-methyltransferase